MKRSQPIRRTPLKRGRKPIKARSAKKEQADAELFIAREMRRLRCNDLCEGATPACPPGPHRGDHAHHIAGRVGGHDVEGLRWICAHAHQFAHANPAWSYEHGLMVRRVT